VGDGCLPRGRCWYTPTPTLIHPATALSSLPFTHPRVVDDDGRLDEQYVQDAFSLAQAKVEHLLDIEVLSSAAGDLMITCVVPSPRRVLERPQ
jgi:hypothetical protein